jgi:hypothetical protein
MKVLLDECIPRKLKFRLASRDCQTVPEAGLSGKLNGELLALTEASGFQIFITIDCGFLIVLDNGAGPGRGCP